MKNLKLKERKKDELQKQMHELYHSKSQAELGKLNNLLSKQKVFQKEKRKEKEGILERHYQTLSKAKSIEHFFNQNKATLVEKNVIFQQDSIRSIFDFYRELDVCKSESMIKKSPEQRKRIYVTLKRKEEEEKRRIEEARLDKLKKLNSG